MSSAITIVKYSSRLLAFAIVVVAVASAFGQSRDENSPTPIAAFPLTGTLSSGTYYYEVPESVAASGAATAVLDLTPPDGGGSMTVTFSGRACCPPEAYIGVTTGLAERIRQATTFNIAGRQPLLVTVYVSVGAKQTISFRLNFNTGAPSSGIIVTPPATPATPATPSGTVCTDLAVDGFTVTGEQLTKSISGLVRNVTTTHRYKGYARRQWLEIREITDSEARPVPVARVGIREIIEPGDTVSYTAVHRLTVRRRTKYEVRIVYSHLNATDQAEYNDDCNSSNNSTRRQLIGPFPTDGNPIAP